MPEYSSEEAARRSGSSPEFVNRLTSLGMVEMVWATQTLTSAGCRCFGEWSAPVSRWMRSPPWSTLATCLSTSSSRRGSGDSLRRISETEAEWFRSEIVAPMMARGAAQDEIGRFAAEVSPSLSEVSDQAVFAIYHSHQGHAWLTNIINGIGMALKGVLEPIVLHAAVAR